LSVLSMAAHTEIFVAGTSVLSFVLLWGVGRPGAAVKVPSIEMSP
jgi:hypothetical protein